jgi:hypothetical protein
MSTLLLDVECSVELDQLGLLTPISRSGGQGRVDLPEHSPAALGSAAVIKLYRSRPQRSAARVLAEMVRWGRRLPPEHQELLHCHAAWPLATVTAGGALTGIAMHDLRSLFEVPFLMPSGRTASVLLQLEHCWAGTTTCNSAACPSHWTRRCGLGWPSGSAPRSRYCTGTRSP